jgi:D-cysteine desulfhydrase
MGRLAARAALEAIPRWELGRFPTPVVRVSLERQELWVKDDGVGSSLYGGNKLRKMEYLLADARERRKTHLVVASACQSHTVLACALHGRQAGLRVSAVVYPQGGRRAWSLVDPRLAQCGARVVRTPNFLMMMLAARLLALGRDSLYVPLGGSSPVATLAYARAALELCDQVQLGLLPEPDLIFVPMASGGTVAGLMIGLALAGASCRVVAVRTVDPIIANQRRLRRLVARTLVLIDAQRSLWQPTMARLARLETRYLGGGYFASSPAAERAVERMVACGLRLETAFTGKTMAATLDALEADPGQRLLFWNTHDRDARMVPAETTPSP